MARRNKAREAAEVTVWPSSFPEDVGSSAAGDEGLPRDCEELGNRFLSEAVEQSFSLHPHWEPEIEGDDPSFDAKMGDALLRSFGLKAMPMRTTTRPISSSRVSLPKLGAPRMPRDLDEFLPDDELDLTDETIREVSLLDHEGEEAGEVESPWVQTEDVHTHGKRRGGHARTSLRPPGLRRAVKR
ncbi:MAG TPA: hypothetical protein VI299_24125 [Polyangiales bacterium]